MTKHSLVPSSLLIALITVSLLLILAFPGIAKTTSCCTGKRGNVDGQGIVDLGDLQALVLYLTGSGYVPPCMDAANVDGKGTVDLGDLAMLVEYLTGAITTLPPCPSDSSITVAQRMAALDSVHAHYQALLGQSQDSIAQALTAYIESLPVFEAAGIIDSTTNVWGRFTDGRLLIIPNDRDPNFPPDSGSVDTVSTADNGPGSGPIEPLVAPSERPGSPVPASLAGIPPELPASSDAYLLSGMSHMCFYNPIPTIKNLLQRQNYSCNTPGSEYSTNGTIANLKNVQDASIFYYDSHGGNGVLKDGSFMYGLWTADVVTDNNDTLYKDMLDAGELAYIDAEAEAIVDNQRTCDVIQHYAITPKFVQKYMSFEKNSLVYIDCCGSDKANMKAAFTAAKASSYLGWSKSVSDTFAVDMSAYLFDRLLGTNAVANTISPKENPPQRPFDLAAIMTDITNRGLARDPWKGAVLKLTPLQDHAGLLAPSIQFLSIREDKTQPILVVAGLFGTDPGAGNRGVTINGQEMFVDYWSPDTIICYLGLTGAKATGTVQVYTKVQPLLSGPATNAKQTSNSVNISEWNGQMEYTLSGPDSLLADLKTGIHFRGDVHSFREKPHQKPFTTIYIFPKGLSDSTGTATFSGSHIIPYGACTETLTLSGTRDMGNVWTPAQHGSFDYNGGIDMIHNQLQFNYYYGAGDTVGHVYFGGGAGCPTTDYPLDLEVGNDSCLFTVLANNVMQLTMTMDSTNYSIKPDSVSCSRKAIYWLYYLDQLPATAQLKWNQWTVKSPPDPKAGR